MYKVADYEDFQFDMLTSDSSIFDIELDGTRVEKCNSKIFFTACAMV